MNKFLVVSAVCLGLNATKPNNSTSDPYQTQNAEEMARRQQEQLEAELAKTSAEIEKGLAEAKKELDKDAKKRWLKIICPC